MILEMRSAESKHPSSFRDPSGFLFKRAGVLYRQVNQLYKDDYDLLMASGLYQSLVDAGLLIPHSEVEIPPYHFKSAYKILQPELITFISYPYEWNFSALKDAALTMLHIQRTALQHGMILKDASAYNIQFHHGKPILIDSLSFQRWREGRPWDGYRQFCQHFFAPLALMAYQDFRLSQLLKSFIDGIPLDLASRLLPAKTYLRLPLLTHIHLHSRMQRRATFSTLKIPDNNSRKISKNSLLGMNDDLQRGISALQWNPGQTRWADYYETFSYSEPSIEHKQEYVRQFITRAKPNSIWDIGANTGRFSRIASDQGIFTVAMDIDPGAVEVNYRFATSHAETSMMPLVMDLMNPSPSLGWWLRERSGLLARGPVDAIMALALVHHLAISNNLPLSEIAGFFATQCDWLLVEFVPKEDVQVQRMLIAREDIFAGYNQENFEVEFKAHFEIVHMQAVQDSSRVLYTMKRRLDE
jgi:hypothetical protein